MWGSLSSEQQLGSLSWTEQNLEWCCWEAPVVTQVFLSKTTAGERTTTTTKPCFNCRTQFTRDVSICPFTVRFKQDATSYFSWAPRLLFWRNKSDFCCCIFELLTGPSSARTCEWSHVQHRWRLWFSAGLRPLSTAFYDTHFSTGLSLVTTVPYQRVLSGGRTITWTSVWLKTKETISDFSKSSSNLEARVVHRAIRVKFGEAYKLPGMCLTPNSCFLKTPRLQQEQHLTLTVNSSTLSWNICCNF